MTAPETLLSEVPPMAPLNGQAKKLLKLDLGCGQNKREGFTGVDISSVAKPDVAHDLFTFPWPFEDESVEEIHSSHFFEHVPAKLRFRFMDEIWRILVPGGKALFICPYADSHRAIQDPTHEWPPICEETFLYFNEPWRKANKLDHYPVRCNFNFHWGDAWAQDWMGRSDDSRAFARRHYNGVISDIHVTLEKLCPALA
jgi:SAM-dependent methyltransferase